MLNVGRRTRHPFPLVCQQLNNAGAEMAVTHGGSHNTRDLIFHSFPLQSSISSLLYPGHYRNCWNLLVGANGTESLLRTVCGRQQLPLPQLNAKSLSSDNHSNVFSLRFIFFNAHNATQDLRNMIIITQFRFIDQIIIFGPEDYVSIRYRQGISPFPPRPSQFWDPPTFFSFVKLPMSDEQSYLYY